MKNYVLAYDGASANFKEAQLLAFIRYNREISEWSVPFSGLYFLKCELSIMELHRSLHSFFQETLYFLTEANPATSAGIIPSEIWDWFNRGIYPEELVEKLKKERLIAGSEELKRLIDRDE